MDNSQTQKLYVKSETTFSMVMSSLCRAQLVSSVLALRTTSYLSVETEYIPWQSALNNLNYYYLMLDRTEVYQPMQVGYFVCVWVMKKLGSSNLH